MRKKIFSFTFILCLIIPCMFMLAGCGDNEDKLVTAPTQSYVISCLRDVPGITNTQAATESTDPNNLLNKPGGYYASIYFSYNLYDKNKKLVPRTDKKYIINPYFMVNSKGKYFLVCNKDNYDALSNYRIDYITDIEVLDTPRKPIKNVSKDVVNPVKYANEHIYMFDGGAKPFKLKLYNERMINEIIDWFGKDVRFIEENGSLFAIIKSNEKALIYWALQYGEQVSIEEPIETKAKITEIIEGMLKKYRE